MDDPQLFDPDTRPPHQRAGLPDPREAKPAPVRAMAHETERAAARMVSPRTGTWRARVLSEIAAAPDGRTDWELEHALGLTTKSTVRTRRSELTEAGWIEDSGRRRKVPDTGNEAIVWVLSLEGSEMLDSGRG